MGHASMETPASFKEFNFTTELTKMPTNKLLSKGKTGNNFLRIYTVSHKNKLKKKKKEHSKEMVLINFNSNLILSESTLNAARIPRNEGFHGFDGLSMCLFSESFAG